MTKPRYFAHYSSFSEQLSNQSHYSQTVRIGNCVECSGQGGWDDSGAIPASFAAELDQAFANVDACLRSARAKGWSDVYKIKVYTTHLGEAVDVWGACALKWLGPEHRPLLTAIGVAALALPGMRVEIEVVALADVDQGQE
ncbi:hypothetical protein VTJ83DRAFT_2808 [Remersonia thermophila]|uniref:Uncharacterized protein n=1 Tax=Remersonia thermophila TaxID=72144 RepID=A0ABR4DJV3_9PEZI